MGWIGINAPLLEVADARPEAAKMANAAETRILKIVFNKQILEVGRRGGGKKRKKHNNNK